MGMDRLKKGKILIEIRVLKPEKLLNEFWNKGIRIYKVKKKNITTLLLEVDYIKCGEIEEIVNARKGKVKIIKGEGFIFFLGGIKKRISLAIGAVLFLGVLYCLSTYIWAIDIQVEKNIAPFDIRQQLKDIGVEPGVKKSSLDVAVIEKKLENINSQILWLRVRVEGGILKVVVSEKVNPPTAVEKTYGNLVAKKGGEIQKIYTFSGVSAVKQGQIVEPGEVLIKGIDGNENEEFITSPKGIVLANVFYEKNIKMQVGGSELERSGKKDEDIYITLGGKKIYLKKALNNFKYCDKIEESGKIFNKVIYYERVEKPIELTDSEIQKTAIEQLEKSLKKDLTRDAKILNKYVTKEKVDDENIKVKVVFVVEENIVNNIPVNY